jgi:hypothetical protein
VLSNMRRHARVHTTGSSKEKELSSDEGGQASRPNPNVPSGLPGHGSEPRWLQRRGSITSSTSSSSRRSRSGPSSDDEDEEDERPEKRSRRAS